MEDYHGGKNHYGERVPWLEATGIVVNTADGL
jgi:hypothetical protein